jgi:hypothetical protein
MGVMEQIIQMKNQGVDDSQIIRNLQEQGISPRQINDALSQIQIKNAVNNENDSYQEQYQEYGQEAPTIPSPNESYEQQEQYQEYPQGDYSNVQQPSYSDIMIEIAEQVFLQKSKKMQKQVEEANEFNTLSKAKIEELDNRLKRIENMIDKLQIAILDKVGSYQDTLGSIKKEMSMMQDTMGKTFHKKYLETKKSR